MSQICFVGPYQPIMCGIADYTSFLVREFPDNERAVLSFDPNTYMAPLTKESNLPDSPIWHGIHGRNRFSLKAIEKGLKALDLYNREDLVLWFQHEFGIWPNDAKFISLMKGLDFPKVVTLHTLHFQSNDTFFGLTEKEFSLLRDLLPSVTAITVFSRGVYCAVTSAFPEYRDKVYVMKHGIHGYPRVASMSRREAKAKLNDFLLYESDMSPEDKETIRNNGILTDPEAIIVGQTGFLCPMKKSELLYVAVDRLRKRFPSKRIIALRIGTSRDHYQKAYSQQLRQDLASTDNVLLETWLPTNMLPVVQKALNINLYWPADCTQSGIVAHALGAGAIIFGRDMEGTGETLKEAGAPAVEHLSELVKKMEAIILNPELGDLIEQKALKYASDFSWAHQARRHLQLADLLAESHANELKDKVVEDTIPDLLHRFSKEPVSDSPAPPTPSIMETGTRFGTPVFDLGLVPPRGGLRSSLSKPKNVKGGPAKTVPTLDPSTKKAPRGLEGPELHH